MKLIEPMAIMDVYVCGLGAVEILKGGNARFIMYVDQTGPDGTVEHVVVQKTIMPIDSVPAAIALAWAITSGAVIKTVQGFLPLHFH